ncbi:MAG: hypothetical protein VKI81_12500 [Synechococcaceae cyanobacterium]|nr:hypothetical protein [Synechococcaceae cyanobacterium]
MTTDATADPSAVGRYGPFAIAVVTISLVVFPIAFNLGAFGQVFYEDVFRFVVAATAGLGVSLLAEPYTGRRRLLTNLALGAPALWLLLATLLTGSVADAASNPVLGTTALVVGVVSIPTVLRMLIDMFVPGFRSYTDTRLLFGGLATVVIIAVAGFFIGANNDRFLTCDDFKVAGSDQPENCAPA